MAGNDRQLRQGVSFASVLIAFAMAMIAVLASAPSSAAAGDCGSSRSVIAERNRIWSFSDRDRVGEVAPVHPRRDCFESMDTRHPSPSRKANRTARDAFRRYEHRGSPFAGFANNPHAFGQGFNRPSALYPGR